MSYRACVCYDGYDLKVGTFQECLEAIRAAWPKLDTWARHSVRVYGEGVDYDHDGLTDDERDEAEAFIDSVFRNPPGRVEPLRVYPIIGPTLGESGEK